MSDQETVVVDDTGGRNSLYVALAVVVGLFLLFLLWLFVVQPLLTDDETDDVDVVAVDDDQADDEGTEEPELPEATPSPDITEGEQLPLETYEVFLSRDPFRPIRPAAGGTDGGGATTGDETTTDGGTATGGTTTDGGTTTGGTTTGGTTTGGELPPTGEDGDGGDRATVEGREVVLVDVFEEDGEPRAVVQVDGTAYEVSTGDRFADNFEVLAIDPPCATLLFGDDSFTLCEGERVLK